MNDKSLINIVNFKRSHINNQILGVTGLKASCTVKACTATRTKVLKEIRDHRAKFSYIHIPFFSGFVSSARIH